MLLTNDNLLILFVILIFGYYLYTKKNITVDKTVPIETYTNIQQIHNRYVQDEILPDTIPDDSAFNNRDYYEKNSEDRLSKLIFG